MRTRRLITKMRKVWCKKLVKKVPCYKCHVGVKANEEVPIESEVDKTICCVCKTSVPENFRQSCETDLIYNAAKTDLVVNQT